MPRPTIATGNNTVQPDEWLEAQCHTIAQAGKSMAVTVGEVNRRLSDASEGSLGRRRRITESQLREMEASCRLLHQMRATMQNAVIDCEHALRELRERDVSPAELLVDGERLIRQYRFLRRRARIMDWLLAYLPGVAHHASACLEYLRTLPDSEAPEEPITVPDCGFALVALEQMREGQE